ncbi:MAG TPA: hypothetical protein PKU80_12890, partial [Candidatus Limiplasma sp.]|nr:hypothetical protein [Candidatus Limiplasma sp.]
YITTFSRLYSLPISIKRGLSGNNVIPPHNIGIVTVWAPCSSIPITNVKGFEPFSIVSTKIATYDFVGEALPTILFYIGIKVSMLFVPFA